MSTAPPAAAAAVDAAADAAPKKRGMLVPLVIGIILLGALGAGGWFFLAPKFLGGAQAKAAPVEPPPVKITVPLGPVVVNLPGEARRYLRVGLSLGVPSSAEAKEIEEHKSQLLDLVISVFSAAEMETLTSEDGKTELKDELLERMHKELRLKKVLRIYFTEFVIQ
jgi:flagellar FliL protein